MRSSFDPLVILLMPRWSEAVQAVQAGYGVLDRADHAFALAADAEEARKYQKGWRSDAALPLLILRVPPPDALDWAVNAVTELSRSKDGRPVGVLLVDGPEVPGFVERKRGAWNKAFAEAVQDAVLDSQVVEYSTTWAASPPRVR